MNYMGWSFIGMHALWWLFWVALIVVFFALIEPVPDALPVAAVFLKAATFTGSD